MVDTSISTTPVTSLTRAQILTFLATNGPILDASGHANRRLRDALGFAGSTGAFTQMLAAMDQSGLLQRNIKGRRTYSIQLGPAARSIRSEVVQPGYQSPPEAALPAVPERPPALPAVPDQGQLDYDGIAVSLLRALGKILGSVPPGDQPVQAERPSATTGAAQRRILNLERTIVALEKDLARARAERNEAEEKSTQLQQQLQLAERNADLLRERAGGRGPRQRPRMEEKAPLDEEETLMLQRLSQRSGGSDKGPKNPAPVPGWPR